MVTSPPSSPQKKSLWTLSLCKVINPNCSWSLHITSQTLCSSREGLLPNYIISNDSNVIIFKQCQIIKYIRKNKLLTMYLNSQWKMYVYSPEDIHNYIPKMSFSLSSQTWTNGVLVKLHIKQRRGCKRYWNYGLMSYLSMVFFKTVHYWCNRYLMTNHMQK